MQTTKLIFPKDIHSESLKVVDNVKFTHREVDILAYLLSGRSAKIISTLLSISPKTIETHMRNIMLKLECHSRDEIINFLEKSNKLALIKDHYASLLAQSLFEKNLAKIAESLANIHHSCLIVSWRELSTSYALSQCLENHLSFIGIKTFKDIREGDKFEINPEFDSETWNTSSILYIIPSNLQKKGETGSGSDQKTTQRQGDGSIVVFFTKEKVVKGVFSLEKAESNSITFKDHKSYYFCFFNLLTQLFPQLRLRELTHNFKDQYEGIYATPNKKESPLPSHQSILRIRNFLFKLRSRIKLLLSSREKRKRYSFFSFLSLLGVLAIFFLAFPAINKVLFIKDPEENELSIRPDFIVPTDAFLLNRPKLIDEIKNSLEGQKDIKTIALVGIAGAGKTTIARSYARQQDASVAWELNAETKENLNDSFESLAEALAKTEEEKKKVRELQDLMDVTERERKIISFVKERLKKLSNWLLIYDNVDKFTEIQEYFPYDPNTWGNGKVIVTTRDKNIENNSHINKAIFIGELSPKEKLDLFVKIMSSGDPNLFTSYQKVQAKKFLYDIPPFPLDVSIAAYYLKITSVPYKKYLEHLKENTQDFAAIQESVLKEATEYTKTRYKIITLSLQDLMNTNKEFSDLLLFISLIDFNNIPRDLLSSYKKDIILEDFIFNLKKYSLITNEYPASHNFPSTFSIHRSTQGISLDYLKKILELDKSNPSLENIFKAIIKHVSEVTDVEDFARIKNLISHCEAILQHTDLLTDSMKGAFESKLGYIYYYMNDYKKAKQMLETSLKDLKKQETENYKRIAHVLRCLGDVYSELGEHEKAKKLCEQSLAVYKKHVSEDNIGLPRALAYLGNVYRRLGDYETAKDLYEKAIVIYKKLGSGDPTREARVLTHLAIVHKEIGNSLKAISLLEQSLALYKHEYSETHTRVAWVYAHLGSVYKHIGNYRKAKELLEYSLKVYKQNFSDDHIRVAWVTSLLGGAYRGLKDYDTAKDMIEKSLITFEKNFGKNHTETARVTKKLGQLYILKGQAEKGEAIVKSAFNTLQKNKHPDSFACLEILADLYLRKSLYAKHQGKIQESEKYRNQSIQLLKQSQEILKNHSLADSPHAMRIAITLKQLENLQKQQEARPN